MVTEKIIFILLAHFIADSALQPERHALRKNVIPRYMITHCLIYAGVMSFVLQYLFMYDLWKSFYLFGIHLVIDVIIGSYDRSNVEKTGFAGWFDTMCHIVSLGVIL